MTSAIRSLVSLFAAALALMPAALYAASPTAAPAIQVKDIDGRLVAPLTGTGTRVFFFVARDCPLCGQYAPEINRICDDYAGSGIAFFIVYVDSDGSAAQAKAHFVRRRFRGTGLLDTRHEIVQRLGAAVTPETVVLGTDGRLLYRGRIDNRLLSWGVSHEANVADLRLALDAVRQGKPVATPWGRPIGCMIPDLGKKP